MNEIIEKELNIEDTIYEIRWCQVMLDSDFAKLGDRCITMKDGRIV